MLTNEAIVLPLPENPIAAKSAVIHDLVAGELVEMDREIHAALLAVHTFSNAVIFGEPGTGKGHPVGTEVPTPGGMRRFGDLVVGDLIFGSDGKPTEVMAVFDRGLLPVFEVAFNDGASVVCDGDHLWQVEIVKGRPERMPEVKDVHSLRGDLHDPSGRSRYRIPLCRPAQFAELPLPLDPYLVGVLLANGYLAGTPVIRTNDVAVIERCRRNSPGLKIVEHTYAKSTARGWAVGGITQTMQELGLAAKKSRDKFVPDSYLYADESARREVLAGLLDCDGCVRSDGNRGQACYATRSRQLADDVRFLVESLGGTARTRSYGRADGAVDYEVAISTPDNPFAVQSKWIFWRPSTRMARTIASIRPVGMAPVRCIQVDAADSLYLITKHFLVTHNTTMTRRIVGRISGAGLYENEFGPFTSLEDVFGPLDLPTLRQTGQYLRRSDNYAPDNEVNIWDEGLNAGEGLQRSMHGLALDRKYLRDGKWVDARTRTIILLSNDPPQTKATRAFFDRILQALWSGYIKETENFITAFESTFDEERPEPVMDWAEIVEAHEQIRKVPVPRPIAEAVAEIRRALNGMGIVLSDRRYKMARRLLQAEAWMDGSEEVTDEHLPILLNCLPRNEDHLPEVEKIVLEYANPLERDSLALLAELSDIDSTIGDGIAASDREQKNALGREAFKKLQRSRKTLKGLRDKAGSSRRQLALLNKIKDKAHSQSMDVLTKVFQQDVDSPAAASMPNFDK